MSELERQLQQQIQVQHQHQQHQQNVQQHVEFKSEDQSALRDKISLLEEEKQKLQSSLDLEVFLFK